MMHHGKIHEKHHGKIFGTVKVGERGQIVIPKEARDLFDIKPGDKLVVAGKKGKGIGLMKADTMRAFAMKILSSIGLDEE